MFKRAIILCCILISLVMVAARRADTDPIALLLARLERFAGRHEQEKVHLHFDKPYYTVGDDIWFKAYVVNARTAKPGNNSNLLYVELINEQNLVKRINLPLEDGITWGDFKLPDSLSEGNYRVRAYTQWMRNAGQEFFFDKTVKVGNAFSNQVFTSTRYTYNAVEKPGNVNAAISFKDASGKAYDEKNLHYAVRFDNREIAEGQTLTGENGEANITFNAPASGSGMLIATLTINKKKVTKHIPIVANADSTDIQFFPEGGYAVNGLSGKIAIKATNATGKGEPVGGVIISRSGKETGNFKTSHLGTGHFYLTPDHGEKYLARIRFRDGSTRTVALPEARNEGQLLTVNTSDSSRFIVRILQTPGVIRSTGSLTLVGQRNGAVYFSTSISAAKAAATLSIPLKNIPSGIVQITLFSADHVPVCERVAFVNNQADKINLEIQGINPLYKKRGKASASLVSANSSEPLEGNFSVAVTNMGVVKPDPENESNIFTNLLLTSDLTGYVEKPNYYFMDVNLSKKVQLDDLLLTQGWRKINWKKLNDEQEPQFAAEKTLKISGTVTDNGKPVAKGKITVVSSEGGFFKLDTVTDARGRFSFESLVFRDSTKFIVQARTAGNKKNIEITLDEIPGQELSMNNNIPDREVNVNEVLYDYVLQSNKFLEQQQKKGLIGQGLKIEEVTVTVDRMQEQRNKAPNSVNLNGPGRADYVFTAKDMERSYTTIKSFLTGKVTLRGTPVSSLESALDLLIVDGNIFRGYSEIISILPGIHPQDVESLELLVSPTYATIYRAGLVMIITTKRGKPIYEEVKYAPGVVTHIAKGYSISRTFYSPVYDTITSPDPDLRTTVYWNPNISAEKGKATFEYYNTDEPGNYRIVVEGLDAGGRLARRTWEYRVE